MRDLPLDAIRDTLNDAFRNPGYRAAVKTAMRDPRAVAARTLIERSSYVMERARSGHPMTRRQAKRYMGCYPEQVLPVLDSLMGHIPLPGGIDDER